MGLFGVGKGIYKIVKGVVTGEADEIIVGIKKVGINLITTIVVNEAHERLVNDDDDD